MANKPQKANTDDVELPKDDPTADDLGEVDDDDDDFDDEDEEDDDDEDEAESGGDPPAE